MRLADVASRIATGLEHTEMRIGELVNSYSNQLHSHLGDEPWVEYKAFTDTFSPRVYKDIHAVFWEMAVLRDVLAQFMAMYCFSAERVTKISSLVSMLKTMTEEHPLKEAIIEITDTKRSGWLAMFGAYRDCFTHSAPLEDVLGITFVIQDELTLADDTRVPRVYFPLPMDPMRLAARRSKGPVFANLSEMIEGLSTRRNRMADLDALTYLHDCAKKFVRLAEDLLTYSPQKDEPIIIRSEDVIGPIRTIPG